MPRWIYPAFAVALGVMAATSASALEVRGRAVSVDPMSGAVTLSDGSVLRLSANSVPVRIGERVTVIYGASAPSSMEERFYP